MATATEPSSPPVVWEPHPGSQMLFLACPFYEVLYTGTRGPGKTDALLMDFAQHVGQGHGRSWRGVLFREESTQAEDLRNKAMGWFSRIFPDARYIGQPKDKWVFPDGEELLFRHMRRRQDYQKYHGHEYPWIGWEELTNWAEPTCYHLMKSCNRSSDPDVPIKYRATCNPYGKGHNWVKSYFIDPAPGGVPFEADLDMVSEVLDDLGLDFSGSSLKTVVIHGHWRENTALMAAQPDYPAHIARSAENPEQARAWLSDDWDIVAGGMFDDVWNKARQVLPVFEVPSGWRIYRSLDWGSSKPFSVGWWLEANGESATLRDGTLFTPPRGSKIRWAEWYGWDGSTPNTGVRMPPRKVAKEIRRREDEWGLRGRIEEGPGDLPTPHPGEQSMRQIFEEEGVGFAEPDKASGSRENGWQIMRQMLSESASDHPEDPGIWVTARCRQFIRTVPTLPRSDRNPDDIDTDAEDHIADETRYAIMMKPPAKATYVTSPWG